MTFRPAGYTAWAGGATNIAEPIDSKKTVGWGINEKPQSSYQNWIENAQDRALDYLRWKAELSVVVSDDFVRATGLGGQSALAFGGPYFSVVLSTNVTSYSPPVTVGQTGTIGGGDMGTAIVDGGGQITVGLLGPVAAFGLRDFRMEFVSFWNNICTGADFQCGFIDTLAFMSTSATGTIGLHWVPSGGTPTSYQFSGVTGGAGSVGGAPGSVFTGFHNFMVERRGPTMIASIDKVTVLAVPGVPFGASGSLMTFGSRIRSLAGSGQFNSNRIYTDRVELLVARDPI